MNAGEARELVWAARAREDAKRREVLERCGNPHLALIERAHVLILQRATEGASGCCIDVSDYGECPRVSADTITRAIENDMKARGFETERDYSLGEDVVRLWIRW